ncbi:MAG: transporter substrate-binding domain-containing protein [Proteobacteria bacterium]|nr:transporter substrate-binding domain-containing protein [Pseudomonadota bacterium]MBU4296944.1 transporter substrate-binding domain-containing protein [Pseudomonadota bacterium]MCG2746958.1 transporter substrate-binding domain-containing protein [Desulfobulbaceae bacterium]
MKRMGIFVLLFLWGMHCSALAAETPKEIMLASEEWTDATNKDGTGLYWDIFRAVYEPAGVKVNFIIRSYEGSINLVTTNKADAVVGSYLNEIKGMIYSNDAFDADSIVALFKKGTVSSWQGKESLKGKTVAYVKGYSIAKYLGVPVEQKEFDTRENILQILDKGRVDFYLENETDLDEVLELKIVDKDKFQKEPVMELGLYLAFPDNDKGKALKAIFDEAYPKLEASGEIQKLKTKWNW